MDFHDFAKRNGMQITAVKQVFRGPDGRRYERLADGSRVPLSGTARDGEVLMFFDGVPDDATGSQPPAGPAVRDSVPAGFFRDAYGRLLPTGTGPERDRVEGFRIARDAMLADAWKAGDAEPADAQANTGSFKQGGGPQASDAEAARKKYEADLVNAWRQSDPELPERSPVAFNSKRREA
ncbi:hypothetical protein V5F32_06070 [Xanthobacter oligotrophicus]|uniref:Uncharacterized protein n=1 Tax=Xanthobacter oligotrophicus TaxID=2607286 RepID=A0ABW6ZSM5_9HYPH